MLQAETCDSIVAVLRVQELAEKAADQRVQEWQEQIKEGNHFKRITPDGLEIFGEVLGPGLSRNWRRCRCYSMSCPEGETGSVHVSQMDILIDKRTFESVKNKLEKAYKLAIQRIRNQEFSFV